MIGQMEGNICKVCESRISEKSPVGDLCSDCFMQAVKLSRLIDYMQTADIKNINIIEAHQLPLIAEKDLKKKQTLTRQKRACLLQTATNKVFELISDETVFGRKSGKADYVIVNSTMSSVHATVKKENGKYFLIDNGSSNGTWLNGERIVPGRKYAVSENDTICFANEKMIFNIK